MAGPEIDPFERVRRYSIYSRRDGSWIGAFLAGVPARRVRDLEPGEP